MSGRITRKTWDLLASAALEARSMAYAPYSDFQVGAALLTVDGEIITGCNVENAAYGLCLCAERNALTTAVSRGQRQFSAMAVATSASPPSPPCGQCLQFMCEFCLDLEILLVNTQGERQSVRLAHLLGQPFRWKGVRP